MSFSEAVKHCPGPKVPPLRMGPLQYGRSTQIDDPMNGIMGDHCGMGPNPGPDAGHRPEACRGCPGPEQVNPRSGDGCRKPTNDEGIWGQTFQEALPPGCSPPDALIREGAALKAEIDTKTARLRQINLALAAGSRFKSGRKTAQLVGAGYKVIISLHENVAWDQEKILKFREYLPVGKFAELFKAVYEPTSKKAIEGFIAHADKDLS